MPLKPLYLQMRLRNIVLDRKAVEYEGMVSCTERTHHQESIADEMYQQHLPEISKAMKEPEFFIERPSKMNDLSWWDVQQIRIEGWPEERGDTPSTLK